jgi:FkbM family methyltransferase
VPTVVSEIQQAARPDGPGGPGGPGLDLDTALGLLFPVGVAPELRAAAAAAAGREAGLDLAALRRILGSVDRLTVQSPALVRFGQRDLAAVRLEDMTLLVDRADASVSHQISQDHCYEPHLSPVFEYYCRPGMTVLDIGANIGYYSLLASRLAGPAGRVLAFEPNSENCRLLLLSAAMNGADNLELLPVGLDERRGWSYFSTALGTNGCLRPGGPALADGSGFVVPVFTLDELTDGPVDLIKIDVEGAEHRVFTGARRILAEQRPIIFTEFSCAMLAEVSGCAPIDYLRRFTDLGYRIYLLGRTFCTAEITDCAEFLAGWGAPDRIEDLLLLPAR